MLFDQLFNIETVKSQNNNETIFLIKNIHYEFSIHTRRKYTTFLFFYHSKTKSLITIVNNILLELNILDCERNTFMSICSLHRSSKINDISSWLVGMIFLSLLLNTL